MKKIFSVLITFFLILCSHSVYAEGLTISGSDVVASKGEVVSFSVSMDGNQGTVAFRVELEWDKEVLSLCDEATKYGENFNAGMIVENKNIEGKYYCSWCHMENVTQNGDVLTLHFLVAENITPGNYPIQISVTGFADEYGNKTVPAVKHGNVTVEATKSDSSGSGSNSSSKRPTISGSSGGSSTSSVQPTHMPEKETDNSSVSENNLMIFEDVSEKDWFFDAVKFAYENNITSGISDSLFAPYNNVTRGQFITMLCRAYGISEMPGDNFDDCGDTWYTGYLAAAKQLGISNGVGDNKFAPEKEITREEMVTLIYNYMVSVNAVDEVAEETNFVDNNEISVWAKAAVGFVNSNGYISGKDGNIFDPKSNATRAELAQIFYNILSDKLSD